MKRIIVFTENNARVLYADELDYAGRSDALIDPDMSKVHGLAPQHWKMGVGEVLPMSEADQAVRSAHIERYGAINSIAPIQSAIRPQVRTSATYLRIHGRSMLLTLVLGAAIVEFLHTYGVLK